MKDRCFEPREGVADGPEVALPVFDEEPSAGSTRGVSRTNFRNCWLFIGVFARRVYLKVAPKKTVCQAFNQPILD